MQRTAVYVDGFNLYYAALRDRPESKWLDLNALAQATLGRNNRIDLIRYCTARVKDTTQDPSVAARQDTYLRALQAHIPHCEFHFGTFVERARPRRLSAFQRGWRARLAWRCGLRGVIVEERQEKGSDVNLATHLLNDAWSDRFDVAAVYSNDSDLAEAMRLTRALGICVGVVTVPAAHAALRRQADFCRRVKDMHLRKSQLPEEIVDASGHIIRRPRTWRAARPR